MATEVGVDTIREARKEFQASIREAYRAGDINIEEVREELMIFENTYLEED